jgi:hypothetical protein
VPPANAVEMNVWKRHAVLGLGEIRKLFGSDDAGA